MKSKNMLITLGIMTVVVVVSYLYFLKKTKKDKTSQIKEEFQKVGVKLPPTISELKPLNKFNLSEDFPVSKVPMKEQQIKPIVLDHNSVNALFPTF